MRAIARFLAAAAIACVPIAGAHAEQALRPWTEKGTPRLVLRDVDGRKVDLAQLRGKVVLVNFWATWCEPCTEEMPSLERLQEKLAGRPFQVLAVNYGELPSRVRNWLQGRGIRLHALLDPDKVAADRWNAQGLPMSFLIDVNGHARYYVFGERDWSNGESVAMVEKLIAEAPRAR